MASESLDRYSRQIRFPQLGEAGQRALLASRVTLCGCGALGTVLANHLARAGVGSIRIIDRDFIETHNLQRQILFDEDDVADNLPKAEAAARKLRAINSTITIEPVVTDLDHTNILDLVGDADLILDGTDNFETRYLINDAAVKLDKPWIYGGVIGSEGQTMTIVPGKTPCLRCLIETAPPPGMTPTCETAGVLGPAVAVIASFEAIEAIKLLTGAWDALNVHLIMVDVWDWTFRQLKVAGPAGQGRLPVLRRGGSSNGWTGGMGSHTTTLCGRNAVQVAVRRGRAARLSPSWPGGSTASATCGTTRSCSGSRPMATSSPCSPTAGRSSRGPTTSPRRGRSMLSLWGANDDLPRQRRHQLSQARAGLSGPGPVRSHQPGEPGQGRAPHGRGGRADARHGAARAEPVLSRRSARALDLHAQLHRRTQPRDQGGRPARRPRRSPPTSSTTRSAGRWLRYRRPA